MCSPTKEVMPSPEPLEGIKFRRFREEDKEQVHKLFQRGIMSLVPDAVYKFAGSPGYLLLTAIVGGILGKLFQDRIHFLCTLLAVSLSMVLLMYRICYNAFHNYVQESIQSDLSNIEQVYVKSGGCFLVAVVSDDNDTTKERVVGTVAAEGKGPQEFELRRMSVCQSMQGRGLGKALIRQLEKECKNGTMTLGTSNVQYAAIAMYSKFGFRRKQRTEPYGNGLFGLLTSFEIYFFEKEF